MPDVTWAPEVVEAVGRRIDPERWAQLDAMDPNDRAFLPLMIAERMRVDAVLAASPLPEAMALIERLISMASVRDQFLWTQRDTETSLHALQADAAAFLARVRGV